MKADPQQEAGWRQVRLGVPTVGVIVALVAAASFAAGQALSPEATPVHSGAASPAAAEEPGEVAESTESLPPGHPAVDPMGGAAPQAAEVAEPSMGQTPLKWRAPARWQLVPSASSMRLATYRVPRAAGDGADAELSITQAGGSVEANVDRWIGQFDAADRSSAKRSARKVGTLDVTMVQVQGKYSGGMGAGPGVGDGPAGGWALMGAIVSTPGMPHFFKMTGPAKTVLAARAEFEGMIGTLELR